MIDYDGWELIGQPVGSGGQGTVYRARRPEQGHRLKELEKKARHLLHQVSAIGPEVSISELARNLIEIGNADSLQDIGALKHFRIPSVDKEEEKQAISRLESEVRALKTCSIQPS